MWAFQAGFWFIRILILIKAKLNDDAFKRIQEKENDEFGQTNKIM